MFALSKQQNHNMTQRFKRKINEIQKTFHRFKKTNDDTITIGDGNFFYENLRKSELLKLNLVEQQAATVKPEMDIGYVNVSTTKTKKNWKYISEIDDDSSKK